MSLLLLLLVLLATTVAAAPRRTNHERNVVDPFLFPILTDSSPSCSVNVLQQTFNVTAGSSPIVAANYTAPSENCTWNRAVLEYSASSSPGKRNACVAAVWIDGVEVLRTSTAESTGSTENDVFWKFRKDVTRYSSLLRRSSAATNQTDDGKFHMMIKNTKGDHFDIGVYQVNISLNFFDQGDDATTSPDVQKFKILYGSPADSIVPISNGDGKDNGFWFQIQDEVNVKTGHAQVPASAYRAVLEVFVSAHSDDELWFSNPPTSYFTSNNLTTKSGNGAFRQLTATVGSNFAGSLIPFPTLYSTSLNPYLWTPVAPIAAFDLPSHYLELTPFLGLLHRDTTPISFHITNALSFWLVGANLHLWFDPTSAPVEAELVKQFTPEYSFSWSSSIHHLDGKFKVQAGREVEISGWANSSAGNITTTVKQEVKYKSRVVYKHSGRTKKVEVKSNEETNVELWSCNTQIMKARKKFKSPVKMESSVENYGENGVRWESDDVRHGLGEEVWMEKDGVKSMSIVEEKQSGIGWMDLEGGRGGRVAAGRGETKQRYEWVSCGGCFYRQVSAADGAIIKDFNSSSCWHSPTGSLSSPAQAKNAATAAGGGDENLRSVQEI